MKSLTAVVLLSHQLLPTIQSVTTRATLHKARIHLPSRKQYNNNSSPSFLKNINNSRHIPFPSEPHQSHTTIHHIYVLIVLCHAGLLDFLLTGLSSFLSRMFSRMGTRLSMSCPSTGPTQQYPSSSNRVPPDIMPVSCRSPVHKNRRPVN